MPYAKSISRNENLRLEPIKNRKGRRVKKRLGKTTIMDARFQPGGLLPAVHNPFHANDTNAYVPEKWAAEAVAILYEEMIYGSVVHRDFDDEIASFGETVHTRKNAEFSGKRKQNDLDNLETQDATAAQIDVVLNQRPYVSFVLGDRERSMSFQDLVDSFLSEAIQAEARVLDRALGGQVYQFLDNAAGGLEQLTDSNGHDFMLDIRKVFNDNKTPQQNRWLGLASKSETYLQKTDLFKSAERIGDGGRALREAMLGRLAGWNTFLELNTPSVTNAATGTATTMSNAETAGTTSFDVASGAALAIGQYITIAGDNSALRVTNISVNTITVNRPLMNNTAASAAVTPVTTALVNQSSAIAKGDKNPAVSDGYPQHWQKEIVYDGVGVPQEGQMVSFVLAAGAAGDVKTAEYCVIEHDSVAKTILLDRPLEDTIDDNAIICLGPNGDFNFALQRNALALVNRPLALPESGTGTRAAIGFANNMSMRVEISRDPLSQGTRVTVDALFGMKPLDTARGGVMYG